jgi:hypothetical protein
MSVWLRYPIKLVHVPADMFSPAAVFGCLPKRWTAQTCPGISRMFAQGGADLFLCKSGITCAFAPHVTFYFFAPIVDAAP